ncbi:MAG: 30S ribosomal protein S17 [Bacilli bacterium]|nr:30S ribosomal protein S17 [Bacilli bacterium]
MMERNNRKVYTGKVVSDKEDKTIKVAVTTYRRHPLYGKRVEFTTKLTAHDENNDARIGDVVKVEATRPLSKLKHFRLVQIVERAEQI